jgi:hypothetical protein
MVTEFKVGRIKTYGTLSGYIYLHIPRHLCQQFGINPSTAFSVVYRDGKLILEQVKESKNAT